METKYSNINMNFYDYMMCNQRGKDSKIAIDYFGRHFTFLEVNESILKVMKSFQEMGLKKGDKISILGLATPEFIFTLYGANKLGIIINLLNPMNPNTKHVVQDVNPKLIFCFDQFYPLLKGAVADEKIIITSPLDSLPIPIQLIGKAKDILKEAKVSNTCMRWKEFIKRGKNVSKELIVKDYIPNEEAIELGTGGSTGIPKQVAVSNEMLNNIIYQHYLMNQSSAFDVEFHPGDVFLDIIPPHLAYGICDVHLALSLNLKLCLEPDPDPKKFVDQLKKHRPMHVLAGPVHWKEFIATDCRFDLSNLKNAVAGGEHLESHDEIVVNKKLKEYGSKTSVREGIGLTEICGVGTYNSNGDRLTVGRPLPDYQIGIFKVNLDDDDYDNTHLSDELAKLYYKKGKDFEYQISYDGKIGKDYLGEVCYQLPVKVLGYIGSEHHLENKKLLRLHEDGQVWVHTGDIGYIREDLNLIITDRIKRVFNRFGWKVYPTYLSELVSTSGLVKENIVIKRSSTKLGEGYVPILYASLKDHVEEEQLRVWCRENIVGNYAFDEIVFVDELPKTGAGKIDFKKIEQYDSSHFSVVPDLNVKVKVLDIKE